MRDPDPDRVEAAMEGLALASCWMPRSIIREPEGEADNWSQLVPLLGSAQLCAVSTAIDALKDQGFEDAEIDAALTEHCQRGRLELVSYGNLSPVKTFHAQQSFFSWLQSRQVVQSRIVVKVEQEVAVLDCKNTIPLRSRLVALFLNEIVKKCGGRVNSTEIGKACPELDGSRLDRLKNKLPTEVSALIESSTDGYRLKAEALTTL